MRLALAAVTAVAAALFQASVVPYLRFAGATPDLVLVVVLLWGSFGFFEGAMVAAFIGGIALDALLLRPLGSTSFVLLLAAAAVTFASRTGARTRLPLLVLTAFALAVATALLWNVVYGALAGPVPASDPFGPAIPDAIYTTAIYVVILPIAILLRRRFGEQERVAW
jgi:rod shape-determining protein MreD